MLADRIEEQVHTRVPERNSKGDSKVLGHLGANVSYSKCDLLFCDLDVLICGPCWKQVIRLLQAFPDS